MPIEDRGGSLALRKFGGEARSVTKAGTYGNDTRRGSLDWVAGRPGAAERGAFPEGVGQVHFTSHVSILEQVLKKLHMFPQKFRHSRHAIDGRPPQGSVVRRDWTTRPRRPGEAQQPRSARKIRP